jgi:hypothetical protein
MAETVARHNANNPGREVFIIILLVTSGVDKMGAEKYLQPFLNPPLNLFRFCRTPSDS